MTYRRSIRERRRLLIQPVKKYYAKTSTWIDHAIGCTLDQYQDYIDSVRSPEMTEETICFLWTIRARHPMQCCEGWREWAHFSNHEPVMIHSIVSLGQGGKIRDDIQEVFYRMRQAKLVLFDKSIRIDARILEKLLLSLTKHEFTKENRQIVREIISSYQTPFCKYHSYDNYRGLSLLL